MNRKARSKEKARLARVAANVSLTEIISHISFCQLAKKCTDYNCENKPFDTDRAFCAMHEMIFIGVMKIPASAPYNIYMKSLRRYVRKLHALQITTKKLKYRGSQTGRCSSIKHVTWFTPTKDRLA